jgi:cell division protein ZapE
VLCKSARSSADYLELARRFHTLLLSDVTVLDDERNDAALRLMHLVDTLYDRNVNLVISAEAPPDGLYRGSRLAERFQRTRSRLEEMQSHEYLARPHLP